MKKETVLDALNRALADEVTAITQYMIHAEMCSNWGFDRLHEVTEKRAMDEMRHAEKLIQRIIFLDETPALTRMNSLKIGATVKAQIENDLADEQGAIRSYNDSIALAAESRDDGSRELFASLLQDEERHMDELRTLQEQIGHLGLELFLAQQVKK